jgi:tRNA(Ile2) C34 agmatinyltransferase TiaS
MTTPNHLAPSRFRECPQCGYRRQVQGNRRDALCRSCRTAEIATRESPPELEGGQWVPDGRGIMRWHYDQGWAS